jgi:hypothetical protein
MANCNLCKDSFTDSRDEIKCVECSNSYHSRCCRVGNIETLKKMGARKASWRCDRCAGKPNTSSKGSLEDASSIAGLSKCIEALGEKIDLKFESLQNSIANVLAEVNTLRTEFNRLREDSASLKRQCDTLQLENGEMKKEITYLKRDINSLQQYSRNNNIEIVGIPFTTGEDIYLVLERLAGLMSVDYRRSDISVAHRLPKNKNARHPSIVVQFLSRTSRMEWLAAARKQRGVESKLLHDSFGEGRVFVNEHLTTHNKLILRRARGLVRENKIAFAWVRDGKVRVRQTSDGAVKLVDTLQSLDSLLS